MPRRLQTHATDEITVTFDPTLCIHAAECIRALPEVPFCDDSHRETGFRDPGTAAAVRMSR